MGTTVPVKRGTRAFPSWGKHLLHDLETEMEELRATTLPMISRPFAWPIRRSRAAAWFPKMDVFTDDRDMVMKIDLPGMKKKDIDVSLDNGNLIVRGERAEEKELKDEDCYRCERSYGSFYRSLPVPADLDPKKVTAKFVDGVLEIRVPLPKEYVTKAERIDVS